MASKVNLGGVSSIERLTSQNSIIAEVDGALRRITLDKFMDSANNGDELLLRQVAWGIPIKETASDGNWGFVGSESAFNEYRSRVGRYWVDNNGKAVKLLSTNSAKLFDGSDIPSGGHVMVIAPKLYVRVTADELTGVSTAWFSAQPIGGEKLSTTADGEYICVGAYLGSLSSDTLVSRAGNLAKVDIHPNLHTAAKRNGAEWGIMDYVVWQWIAAMGLSHCKGPNVQAKIGSGVIGNEQGAPYADPSKPTYYAVGNLKVGTTAILGDSTGKIGVEKISNTVAAPEQSCHVSLMGIEDFWGLIWQGIQGVIFDSLSDGKSGENGVVYKGNRLPATTPVTGETRPISRNIGINIRDILNVILGDKFDLIATTGITGTPSAWGDKVWVNSANKYISVGGYCAYSTASGIVAQTTLTPNVATRVAYYGNLTFSKTI